MRQVPNYLIIGNGRVARHFCYYFTQLNLPFVTWCRNQSLDELRINLNNCTHALILISDSAINSFCQTYLSNESCYKIHFSGSLVTPYAYGAHPLMTFASGDLYGLAKYQSIPFILDHDAPEFNDLLPGLTNPHHELHTSLKPKYHALCVLSGNFSCMLWQKIMNDFQNILEIPATMTHAYLEQMTMNLIHYPKTALTGPFVRNDHETIFKNLKALENDPYQGVYQSFITCYQQLNEEKSS